MTDIVILTTECESHMHCFEGNYVSDGNVKLHRWSHGTPDWTYDADLGVWVSPKRGGLSSYCLGERMSHPDYGRTAWGEVYRSCYDNGWHSGPDFHSAEDAIAWVKGAEHGHFGAAAWGKVVLS